MSKPVIGDFARAAAVVGGIVSLYLTIRALRGAGGAPQQDAEQLKLLRAIDWKLTRLVPQREEEVGYGDL